MFDWKQSLKKGLRNGLVTTWDLGKIIFPITLLVTVLEHTPVIDWLVDLIAPVMSIFGLPGEAAIPLVLGNLLNLYAGIGAILSLEFTVKEVFIIAVMLSFSHNLLIESGVVMKSGVRVWIVLAVRIGLATIAAMLIHLLWNGGGEIARYGWIATETAVPDGWHAIILDGLMKATNGVIQLAIIVIPLMIGIQIIKDLHWLEPLSKWLAPLTRILGMKENTSLALLSGLVFGLAFGSGVLLQSIKEDGVSRKDATIVFIFLVACHAVVEDTLIFVPLGISVLPLLIIRIITAFILTMIIGNIWNHFDRTRRKELIYEG
ncbi:MAG: nucleoside recognition domain-containing protein [Caldibacillus sp.]